MKSCRNILTCREWRDNPLSFKGFVWSWKDTKWC